jgi:hypothetical protein
MAAMHDVPQPVQPKRLRPLMRITRRHEAQ